VLDKLDEHLAKPLVPDRATWGTGAAQQQAQAAMLAFAERARVGGSAPRPAAPA
jgi:hypothetical protein